MSGPLVKLYLFLVWPLLAVLLLPVIALMFVALWVAIPFGVVEWKDSKLKWTSPWVDL